jgi:hypothetical protein
VIDIPKRGRYSAFEKKEPVNIRGYSEVHRPRGREESSGRFRSSEVRSRREHQNQQERYGKKSKSFHVNISFGEAYAEARTQ